MLWEGLYTALVWLVLLIGGALAGVIWLAWRVLLPKRWRDKTQESYQTFKNRLHELAINSLQWHRLYLKAYITWHAHIVWRPKYYWLKLKERPKYVSRDSNAKRVAELLIYSLIWWGSLWLLGRTFGFFETLKELVKEHWLEVRLDGAFSLTLLGLVPLFFLWIFRDRNALMNLENQRKDTNLKDFQQLQAWAAGVVKDEPDEKSRDTLRIAAIHQLARFLDGEHGESFVQPTFELLKALPKVSEKFEAVLNAAVEKSQEIERRAPKDLHDDWKATRESLQGWRLNEWVLHAYRVLLGSSVRRLRQDRWGWSRVAMPKIVLSGAFLPAIKLVACKLPAAELRWAKLQGADLKWTELQGADLSEAELQGADFFMAQLQGADLSRAQLQGVDFFQTRLQGVNLSEAQLQGADFFQARLHGANLSGAELQGASLFLANLQGTDLRGVKVDLKTVLLEAVYDDTTQFGRWDDEKRAWVDADGMRNALRELGLRHINEVSKHEAASNN